MEPIDRDEAFESAVRKIMRDPQHRIVMRALELGDTGLSTEESLVQARSDWWINHRAKPNGIGPVCIVCDRLIDWAARDHAVDCTVREYYALEYVEGWGEDPWEDDGETS